MKESDIRNTHTLDKYIALVNEDVARFIRETDISIHLPCIACESLSTQSAIQKPPFQYVQCEECKTLYVNPRPTFESLGKIYSDSPSTLFWIHEFFLPVAEARREKIFAPRARYFAETFPLSNTCTIGDIGAGFGLFLEELHKLHPNATYIAIEPSQDMAARCEEKGFQSIPLMLEEVDPGAHQFDYLTAYELVEHLHTPASFFQSVFSLLKPGGTFVLTTLNGLGFDIQVLWERSRALFPPVHLNFFNPDSLQALLERVGFSEVVVTTPGLLDWDIVENSIQGFSLPEDRFWQTFSSTGTPESKQAFQDWISSSRMSSHMRVVAKK